MTSIAVWILLLMAPAEETLSKANPMRMTNVNLDSAQLAMLAAFIQSGPIHRQSTGRNERLVRHTAAVGNFPKSRTA